MNKPIELIVAVDTNYGIGLEGKIPWRCTDDMVHFKETTTTTQDPTKQNAVIMGRKTWESLKGKPLKNRINICLSKSPQLIPWSTTMEAAIKYANTNPIIEKIFIIGGERVYQEAVDNQDVACIWITRIKREFPTDRKVRFMKKYLSKFENIAIVRETAEYCIWKYSQ